MPIEVKEDPFLSKDSTSKWEKLYLKEGLKQLELQLNISDEFDRQLAVLEKKYKKTQYKSFEHALYLRRVSKGDMVIYGIIKRFLKVAMHPTYKNTGK